MQIESLPNSHATSENRPSERNWWLSLALFLLVALSTIGLLGYNYFLDKKIQTAKQNVAEIESQIQIISSDRKVVIANILKTSSIRPTIPVKELIGEFYTAAAKSNVRFKGFSIKNDIISTNLIATEGDPLVHPDPAITIIKMIEDYSRDKKDFSLDPISTLGGDLTQRTTGIQFRVVPKIPQ